MTPRMNSFERKSKLNSLIKMNFSITVKPFLVLILLILIFLFKINLGMWSFYQNFIANSLNLENITHIVVVLAPF